MLHVNDVFTVTQSQGWTGLDLCVCFVVQPNLVWLECVYSSTSFCPQNMTTLPCLVVASMNMCERFSSLFENLFF